jgi:hypothetical protein
MTKHLLWGLLLVAALGCASGDNGSSGTAAGNPSSNSPNPSVNVSTPPPTLERLIEEGDIVWLDDPVLYVLNKTRGLSVIGLGNPAKPLLIGRVALQGTPVEMYLHNGHVLALNSQVYSSTGSASSRLTIIDVGRPEAPVQVASVSLTGTTTNSRLVGNVLYTASDSGAVIESVDVGEPRAARVVDRLTLPLGSNGSHVLATESVFYVATESFRTSTAMGECASSSSDNEGCTTIFAVDISSPIGALRFGANYSMAGLLKDRWGMDAYDGVLRVLVARGGWWTSSASLTASLRTFRAKDASQLDPLASFSLATARPEKVTAVRFDGPRAYLVTFRQTDPLFTIDLSDPAHPSVAGYLQTPGWLDFIIPRGNRLLGVGRDQDLGTGQWRLHASVYDVSKLSSPVLMNRMLFGQSYSVLPDQADNLAKVVRLVEPLNLLLVPYNSESTGYSKSKTGGSIEIISYAGDTLSTYGQILAAEAVVRALPLPPNHLAAVSESAVGVIQLAPTLQLSGVVDLNQSVTGSNFDGGARD